MPSQYGSQCSQYGSLCTEGSPSAPSTTPVLPVRILAHRGRSQYGSQNTEGAPSAPSMAPVLPLWIPALPVPPPNKLFPHPRCFLGLSQPQPPPSPNCPQPPPQIYTTLCRIQPLFLGGGGGQRMRPPPLTSMRCREKEGGRGKQPSLQCLYWGGGRRGGEFRGFWGGGLRTWGGVMKASQSEAWVGSSPIAWHLYRAKARPRPLPRRKTRNCSRRALEDSRSFRAGEERVNGGSGV